MANEIHFSDICAFAADAMRDQSRDDIEAQCAISGSTLNVSRRLFRRYASAERYAERYTDLIGVGVISFAAQRVGTFVDRCKARGIAYHND